MDSAHFKLGDKELSLRGSTVVNVVVVLACTFVVCYVVERNGRAIADMIASAKTTVTMEHRVMVQSLDRQSCLLSMSQDSRDLFRRSYQPGAFQRWCPWIDSL